MNKELNMVWDLDVFFAGGSNSREFTDFLGQLEQDIGSLDHQIKQLNVPQNAEETADFQSVVLFAQNIETRLREASAFTECLTAQNTKDDKAKLLYGRVIQYMGAYSSAMIGLDERILHVPQEVWDALLTSETIRPIAFPVNERRIRSAEKLPPAREVLANDLAVDGYHAWSELYSSLVGRIVIPVEKDGQLQELSVGQASNLLQHADRTVRAGVFEIWEEAWKDSAELCAQTLNHLGGFRLNLYRHRGWDSVHKEPLNLNRMSAGTLHAMWDVIDQNKDKIVTYLKRKAKLLGIEKMSWFDLHAPIGSSSTQIPYQKGAEFIVEQFRKFSPKMADFAVQAFEDNWIEAEDRPGKRPGGFCTSFGKSKQTRIFMTYAGTPSNVSTLAHELGHAYHDYVMNDMPQMVKNYAMNVAETASTFAEMVVADAAVKNAANQEERLALIDEKAQNAVSFLMDIHARFLFETNFYEQRKKGLLSVDELNDLMVQAQKQAFRDALDVYHPYFWASKLHFYITDYPFYNFPYTFGYLFSYGVYARALQEGPTFEDRYIALLRDTGRMTVEELAQKHLDVDLTKSDFWQSAVRLAIADVEEFLHLTE